MKKIVFHNLSTFKYTIHKKMLENDHFRGHTIRLEIDNIIVLFQP